MKDLRICSHAGLPLAALFAFSLLSTTAHAAGAEPDISGVYWANQYDAKIELVGGGELPLNEEGMAAHEANMAGLEDGSIADIARMRCVPDGLPRALATPYPFEIVQAPPGQVLMIHELNHQIRVIALDQPQQSAEELLPYPWFNGHSVGHWEDDTLVVETAGFNDRTFVDATGAPHSDQITTTERVRRTSPTELEIVITVSDPLYYTEDWQARFVYALRNDVRIEDYICGHEHRDISHIPGINEARAARSQ
jgi:hypothetical protein